MKLINSNSHWINLCTFNCISLSACRILS